MVLLGAAILKSAVPLKTVPVDEPPGMVTVRAALVNALPPTSPDTTSICR